MRSTAVSHLEQLLDRCDKAVDAVNTAIHATEKERRQFPVCVDPQLATLLQSYAPPSWQLDMSGLEASHTIGRHVVVGITEGVTSRSVTNALLSPIYAAVDEGVDRHVRLRLSSTSRVTHSLGNTCDVAVHRSLKALHRELQRLPGLRDLILRVDAGFPYDTAVWGLDDPPPEHFVALVRMAAAGVSTPLLHTIQEDEIKRLLPLPVSCTLRIKVYLNRADIRAYAADESVIRSIAGAIVQAIFRPRPEGKRNKMEYRDVWPSVDSNSFNNLEVPIREHHHAQVSFGDISSFTASNVNTWVTVLTAIHVLTFNDSLKHLNVPCAFSVHGESFTATPLEALKLYLYTSTMPEVYDSILGDVFRPVGGILGINGNICMATMAFSICMQGILSYCEVEYAVTGGARLSGDDFAVWFSGPPGTVQQATNYAHGTVQRYVGRIKEFQTVDITSSGLDVILEARFCKHDVHLRVVRGDHGDVLILNSLPHVPLHQEFSMCKPWRDTPVGKQSWFNVLYGLWDCCRDLPEGVLTFNYLIEALVVIRNVPAFGLPLKTYYIMPASDILEIGTLRFTIAAHQIVEDVPPIWMDNGACRTSLGTKLSFACEFSRVVSARVCLDGACFTDSVDVFMTPGDQRNCQKMGVNIVPCLGGGLDPAVLARVIEKLRAFRDAANGIVLTR